MSYVVFALVVAGLSLAFAVILIRADVTQLARVIRYGGSAAAFLLGFALSIRGAFIFALPLFLLGFTLLGKKSPFGASFPWAARKSPNQSSRVRTSLIEMMLDHDTGAMSGRVLAGKFEGKSLDELELQELAALHETALTAGDQSADLLETYLDRFHPDWARHPAFAGVAGREKKRTGPAGPMSPEEAYEVLGLGAGAGEAEVRKAHKALMKKLHPDQSGGSNYLASKINEAKDVLLKGL